MCLQIFIWYLVHGFVIPSYGSSSNLVLVHWFFTKLWPLDLENFINYQFSALFSSPELKAQVSFSDRFLSVVRLSVCRLASVVCKLFTFLTSSPEPLDQFWPNLAQSILRFRGFKVVKIKDQDLFKGEIIGNYEKNYEIFKILLPKNK
jgi:hypothetical protein